MFCGDSVKCSMGIWCNVPWGFGAMFRGDLVQCSVGIECNVPWGFSAMFRGDSVQCSSRLRNCYLGDEIFFMLN